MSAVARQKMSLCNRCESPLTTRIDDVAIPRTAHHRQPERKPRADDPKREGYLRGTSDGKVYCSNEDCSHRSEPHPAGAEINRGPVEA